ncbi:DUF2254 domain-containing protein [Pseudomonas sp. Choline-3u-10]|jgi:uncharacterized membrane protein|uniref:DUF2254 domain-containing protein n=1 Tax=Pseudomonadaceae TaxID=135621 RepID=UPI000617FC38|nr:MULTISPECIES: DUF2254 domain-containing protein [Pseudomonadaceae]MAL36716.1 DUF2254 domain-containing protein [Pseudomonas sp.]MBU0947493.1 DUF2254 domain-containing protein [Gammaproteobacteria bacterium]KJJ62054.1 hypothetical protein RT21_17010 [Pseudomonas sp. 10B238]MBK3795389.1 DUF2254 domain-containing protein [Stutzerimonas stutzeri]MBK3878256.1 DUF2254 domain-containing protein [Stutzerimonas stutzeri]|tara:strand:- start:397 stop:1671 length:1275 start_codon:yes stop_codon:yes gene_type:complete
MIERWKWFVIRISKRPWFRASLYSVLGIATALVALVAAPYIPEDVPTKIGSDAVDNILGVLASSMLAVTTFSLSIMVAAYGSATNNVTPRAISLLVEDPTTQNTLSTFVGSFIFSLVGIIALSTGLYGDNGRVVLFAATIFVVILVVYALLRWIDQLSGLGRVAETTARVEKAATQALCQRMEQPFLGGRPLEVDPKALPGARPLYPQKIGFVQHIDMPALGELTQSEDRAVYICVLPGIFVEPSQPIAWSVGIGEDCDDALRDAFVIGAQRTFDRDPRYGIIVMAEVASRALSPAINDQGTAVDVIGRGVRVLSHLSRPTPPEDPKFDRVFAPGLSAADMLDDFFTPIARDGAAIIEVCIRLQQALASLGRLGDAAVALAANRHASMALRRAEAALTMPDDYQRVCQAADAAGLLDTSNQQGK